MLRLLFAALLFLSPPLAADTPALRGTSNAVKGTTTAMGGVVFNIQTDFGATCNGVADDGPAWTASSVAMRANAGILQGNGVTLIVPSGCVLKLASCPFGSDGDQPFNQISNFTLIATGATINATGNCGKWFKDVDGSLGHAVQLPFHTNLVGDSCVTMVNPGDEVNYQPFFHGLPVWVTVAGQGLQNTSFPPNYANWEFAQVASTPPGQVCFTAPLVHAYPDNIADQGGGNCVVYCGGPGRLLRMSGAWGGYFHLIGGNWILSEQKEWAIRTLILDNVLMTAECQLPSFNGTVTYNNTNLQNCFQEEDKEVQTITLNNSNITHMVFQSASIDTLILNSGSTVRSLQGTPLHTVCNDSTITTAGFGNTIGSNPQTFAGVNCNLPNGLTCCSTNFFEVPSSSPTTTYLGGGQFKILTNLIPAQPPGWWTIGGHMQQLGGRGPYAAFPFTITGTTYDQGTITIIISTTFTGSLPPIISPRTDNLWAADPLRDVTCTNCIGSAMALDLSLAPAQHQPAFTYSNRTYTCANNVPNAPGSYDINSAPATVLEGAWTSWTANVTTPDTNPADAASGFGSMGLGWYYNTVSGVENFDFFGFRLNLRIAGTRSITPSGVTGAQSGDILTPFTVDSGTWISGIGTGDNGASGGVNFKGDFVTNGPAAQCPVVNVEWVTTR